MAAPISLLGDFDGPMLRALALSEKTGSVTRRLLALVTIYEGGARAVTAKLGGVGLQTIRDWVLRFNAKGPDGLIDGESTGRPSKLNNEQRRALVVMVEVGPIPAIHEVSRWRLIDLAQWIFAEYGVSVTKQILSRELRALGYRKLSARPRHHEHDEAAVAALKRSPRSPSGQAGGQRQAARAVVPTRSPHRPKKQNPTTLGRTQDAPFCPKGSEDRLGLHLRRHLSRERQGDWSCPAILQLRSHGIASAGDRASKNVARHREAASARKHEARPPPVQVARAQSRREHLAIHVRDNWLSSRIFPGYEDILDQRCFNWNKLVERPWFIMSIASRHEPMGSAFGDLASRDAPQHRRAALAGPNRRRSGGVTSRNISLRQETDGASVRHVIRQIDAGSPTRVGRARSLL